MNHEIDVITPLFEPMMSGDRSFHVCRNWPNTFQKSDYITFHEVTSGVINDSRTGRMLITQITYVQYIEKALGLSVVAFKVSGH